MLLDYFSSRGGLFSFTADRYGWAVKAARASLFGLLVISVMTLAGCATWSGQDKVSYNVLMNRAQSKELVGDREGAVKAYKRAAKENPVKGQPWVELAQLYFAGGDYARAIVAAMEGQKRSLNSWRADSVLTISGLRVALKSLKHLRNEVGVRGPVREEAQRLVQLMQTALGVDTLVPGSTGSLGASEVFDQQSSSDSGSGGFESAGSTGVSDSTAEDTSSSGSAVDTGGYSASTQPVAAESDAASKPASSGGASQAGGSQSAGGSASSDPFSVLKVLGNN